MPTKPRRPATGVRPQDRWIRRIEVESLFGRYHYDLNWSDLSSRQVLLLYGDNGAGKTNLLRLVFHLLNEQPTGGHRTHIAHVTFRRLRVELNDGSFVEASRKKPIPGSFEMRVQIGEDAPIQASIVADETLTVTGHKSPSFAVMLKALRRLRIRMYFVTDQRELLSNRPEEESDKPIKQYQYQLFDPDTIDDDVLSRHAIALQQQYLVTSSRPSPEKTKSVDNALMVALQKAQEWAKERALIGSRQGEADASSLYANMLQDVINFPSTDKSRSLPDLVGELEKQADRSAEYAKSGIPTAENIRALVEIAYGAPESERELIARMLQPYLQTLRARLDALTPVHRAISDLINTINSFYLDKTITFTIGTGVRIIDDAGQTIPPLALSSGEKQLLLLFCNALVATGPATIFFIDEPELSLNGKWQRQLVDALLTVTEGKNIQFILATHSFEILAQHRSTVMTLRSQGEDGHGTAATDAAGSSHVSRA